MERTRRGLAATLRQLGGRHLTVAVLLLGASDGGKVDEQLTAAIMRQLGGGARDVLVRAVDVLADGPRGGITGVAAALDEVLHAVPPQLLPPIDLLPGEGTRWDGRDG